MANNKTNLTAVNSEERADAEKDWFIEWIHKVEFDPENIEKESKRLPGIVTEMYFETVLAKESKNSLYGKPAFGWTYKTERGSSVRQWFKVSDGSDPEISKKLIATVSAVNPNDKFFVIEPSVSAMSGSPVPCVRWNVTEILHTEGQIKRSGIQNNASQIRERLDQDIAAELSRREARSVPLPIKPWLQHIDKNALKRLFAVRCLMNFGRLYLTDIDAVNVDTSNTLEFWEFKRKGPATGETYQIALPGGRKATLGEYLERIHTLNRLNPSSFTLAKMTGDKKKQLQHDARAKINERLADQSAWHRSAPCQNFGLDTSHAANVALCGKAGITYRYIIWNSTKHKPSELLTDRLVPIEPQCLLALNVIPSDIESISKTDGADSGTYTDKTRFQLMIPYEKFIRLSRKADGAIGEFLANAH